MSELDNLDVLNTLKADAEAALQVPADEQLEGLSGLARRLIRTDAQIMAYEELLKGLKEESRRICEQLIPDAMRELGLSRFTLEDGSEIACADFLRATVAKENAEAAYRWLDEQGLGDLVKHDVTVTFGRGESDEARSLVDMLSESGMRPTDREYVAWNTLSATIKEMEPKGLHFPEELFKVYRGTAAKVRAPR